MVRRDLVYRVIKIRSSGRLIKAKSKKHLKGFFNIYGIHDNVALGTKTAQRELFLSYNINQLMMYFQYLESFEIQRNHYSKNENGREDI